MSGLKINFHKSEVICLGDAKNRSMDFEEIFTCKSGVLPMKYLGIPIDEKILNLKDWKPILEKHENKLSCWQGKNLVISGRFSFLAGSNGCEKTLLAMLLN
jgi:hypothetical protein